MSAVRFHPKAPPARVCAGVAQPAEQLICNQQVVGSIPITSSTKNHPAYAGLQLYISGGLQSGQMHQTVNLTSPTSVVRIHLLPPAKRHPIMGCRFAVCTEVAKRNAAWFARAGYAREGLPRVPLGKRQNPHTAFRSSYEKPSALHQKQALTFCQCLLLSLGG